ncbi:hypothetical protein QMI71_004415 [Salmonella enterica]|nr:hypothetical protein [Salmonella enterica]
MDIKTEVKSFSSYSSKLGYALFPQKSENTFFECEARSIVSELLHKHNGEINSAKEFLYLLESFTPAIVQDSIDNPSWATEKVVGRWNGMTKSMIINRVKQFFASEFMD